MAVFGQFWKKRAAVILLLAVVASQTPGVAHAADLYVPASRSTLVKSPRAMGEVIVADPSIADVHAHGENYLSIIGKSKGSTTVRVFDTDRKLIQSYNVTVGYDLVAIRQALKNFLPDETIGVETVNMNIALTGQVSSATVADKAIRIVSDFIVNRGEGGGSSSPTPATVGTSGGSGAGTSALTTAQSSDEGAIPGILNLLQISSGQQVMLRVRVGEIQRDALKSMGVDLSNLVVTGRSLIGFGTGAGLAGLFPAADGSTDSVGPGQFLYPADGTSLSNTQGVLAGRYTSSSGDIIGGAIRALERDGLFKLLAEPNLVAISGEQAEFLAGGEIPVPIPQNAGGTGSTITIEYKPFGVGVKFKPYVLSENRIRVEVFPEVSELDYANAITLDSFKIPAIATRRAKTVVELAPGESFMVAGLIKDSMRSTIDQLPGVKELPIIGALFRSTNFQRNETELVISVTPYLVDPMKGSDVKLPTDNFAPASQMEMFFYGALGTLSNDANRISQTPSVEGPIGFMMD